MAAISGRVSRLIGTRYGCGSGRIFAVVMSVAGWMMVPALAAALRPALFKASALPPAQLYRKLSNRGMFGGDVVNGIGLFKSFENDPDPMKHYTYWTNGIIYYTSDSSVDDAMHIIKSAMNEVQSKTCIRFQRLKPGERVKNFVKFTAVNPIGGCWSSVGMDTRQSQTMNLQRPECWDKGVILHELVHNIGFYHEHQRPDRDNYIDVIYKNVRPDIEAHQFSKFPPHKVVDTGIPYDLDSIMHYDTHAFGIVDETGHPLPTIIQKPPNEEQMILPIWARPYLSKLDAREIDHVYAHECRKRGVDWGRRDRYKS